ncbi:MAG: hypothetical protein B7Z23_07785, partial [Pseudomonadales bacterium 32-61-5]
TLIGWIVTLTTPLVDLGIAGNVVFHGGAVAGTLATFAHAAKLASGDMDVTVGIPCALGHPVHEHLDSDSTLTWTLIPQPLGH